MVMRRAQWGLWTLCAAGLCFFENNTGTRTVFLLSLLLPLFSAGCALICARHAGLEKRDREVCFTLKGPALGCIGGVDAIFVRKLTGERQVLHLRAGEPMPLAGIGAWSLEPVKAWTGDFFGLFSFPADRPGPLEGLLMPDLFPVAILENEARTGHGTDAFGRWQRGFEPGSGVRDYALGDPAGRIHWKLSEKLQKTVVRDSELPPGGLCLAMDTSMAESFPDKTLEAARSFLSAAQALSTVMRFAVCWQGEGEAKWETISCREGFDRFLQDFLRTAEPAQTLQALSVAALERPEEVLLFCPAEAEFPAEMEGLRLRQILPQAGSAYTETLCREQPVLEVWR